MRRFLSGLFAKPITRRRKSAGWVADSVERCESRVVLSANAIARGVATAAVPANFAGTWEINGNAAQVLSLAQDGSKVVGTFAVTNILAANVKGSVNGASMTLKSKFLLGQDKIRMRLDIVQITPTTFSGVGIMKAKGELPLSQPFAGVKI